MIKPEMAPTVKVPAELAGGGGKAHRSGMSKSASPGLPTDPACPQPPVQPPARGSRALTQQGSPVVATPPPPPTKQWATETARGKQRVQLYSCGKEMRLSAANNPSPEFSVQSEVPSGVRSQGQAPGPQLARGGRGRRSEDVHSWPLPARKTARGEGTESTPGSNRVSRGGGEGRGGNHTGERRAPSGNQPPRCSEIPCRSRGRAALPGGAQPGAPVSGTLAPSACKACPPGARGPPRRAPSPPGPRAAPTCAPRPRGPRRRRPARGGGERAQPGRPAPLPDGARPVWAAAPGGTLGRGRAGPGQPLRPGCGPHGAAAALRGARPGRRRRRLTFWRIWPDVDTLRMSFCGEPGSASGSLSDDSSGGGGGGGCGGPG